ncbi:MAG: winged helix-turn-helix domain-containing protein [Pseudomonadota bacterium]
MLPSGHYQFGSFRLDAGARVLFLDGNRVALAPKAVDLLIALVEARGRPVGKEELLAKVWAGTVVEEGSLTSHISLLRKAIGGGFIETLSKRGYRFVGQVVDGAQAIAPPGHTALLAVQAFACNGIDDGFGESLAEQAIIELIRLGAQRWGVIALTSAVNTASHRLEGKIWRAGEQVRITAQLVRVTDGIPLWAESYERRLQDELTLQTDIARTFAQEIKTRLAPVRTLSFLMTAIEGAVPADAAAEQHNALVRDAITRYGGRSFRIHERGFCAAFPDASSALRAAAQAQQTLCSASFQVRMGLHSGAVENGEDDDLTGPTLARTARVMNAAQGGQILLTAATLAALNGDAPPACEWRDLGDHTLRGFARPERLYQLIMPGMRSEFAPIRTQEAMRTNLPPPLSNFIGRKQAMAQLHEQMHRSRMVTLVGAGGTGKTRLALEAARQFATQYPDGVWLIELAPLVDPALVPRAIVNALGTRSEGDTSPLALIESTLREQRVLLLLDNCEHLIDEAAKLAQLLLRALPELHLLATSRQPLGIDGEAIYRVPSMTMPGVAVALAPPDVIASEAGQLFMDRARAVQPSFALTDRNAAAIAKVCWRLDGIPLALELAAARLTALSIEEIAQRLDDRFHLLTGGLRTAMPRQRTLRALVDWSYELLPTDERAVLDSLAVFAGSFSLAAAEQVATEGIQNGAAMLDIIELLVAKSLLIAQTQDGADTRYRMLETIRQYANEKLLESGHAAAVQRRHFDFFLRLAETGASTLAGPLALEWLDRLEAEHDNFRAALDWSGDATSPNYAQLAGTLRTFWDIRGHYTEGWRMLERALAIHTARDQIRLDALIGAGLLSFRLAYSGSDALLGDAIALAQELGNRLGEAEATLLRAYVLRPLGGDIIEPQILRAQALAKSAGSRHLEAIALLQLGRIAGGRSEYANAQELFSEGTKLLREAGCLIHIASALHYAGYCAIEQLDFSAARLLLDDALVQHRRVGNVHDAATTVFLQGRLALREHRLDEAHALAMESLRIFQSLHDPKCEAENALDLATVLLAMGDAEAALPLAEHAAAAYRGLELFRAATWALRTVGCIHARLGQNGKARHALFSGLLGLQERGHNTSLPELLEGIAGMHPNTPVAAQLLGAAESQREQRGIPIPSHESAERQRWHKTVRAELADAAFKHAFATGRSMTRDETIEAALALRAGSDTSQ